MRHVSREFFLSTWYVYPWCEFDAIYEVFYILPSANTWSVCFGSFSNICHLAYTQWGLHAVFLQSVSLPLNLCTVASWAKLSGSLAALAFASSSLCASWHERLTSPNQVRLAWNLDVYWVMTELYIVNKQVHHGLSSLAWHCNLQSPLVHKFRLPPKFHNQKYPIQHDVWQILTTLVSSAVFGTGDASGNATAGEYLWLLAHYGWKISTKSSDFAGGQLRNWWLATLLQLPGIHSHRKPISTEVV